MLWYTPIFPGWFWILLFIISWIYVAVKNHKAKKEKRQAEEKRIRESNGFSEMIYALKELHREYESRNTTNNEAYSVRIREIKDKYLDSGGNIYTFDSHLRGECLDLWCKLYREDHAAKS